MISKQDRNENGNVTVIAIGLCCVALALSLGLAKLGGFAGVKGKAQNAADAASLSAAYDIAHFKPGGACASAKKTASANGASLIKCDTSSTEVEVQVSIEHEGESVKAKARAFVK